MLRSCCLLNIYIASRVSFDFHFVDGFGSKKMHREKSFAFATDYETLLQRADSLFVAHNKNAELTGVIALPLKTLFSDKFQPKTPKHWRRKMWMC